MQELVRATILSAPDTPGIYLFRNAERRIIYVGKAANLRARLRSYLRPGWKENMIEEAASIELRELASDIEALISEAELIKKERPRFNILFRDDKNYFYVCITRDRFPRIYLTHQPKDARTEGTYIGPFTDGTSIKRVLRLLRDAFPYCTCSPLLRHKRACVNAQIGKCLGFCCRDVKVNSEDRKRYSGNIRAIKAVLEGKRQTLAKKLEREMALASSARQYERAQILRDQIAALARIFEHSPFLKKEISEERDRALRLLQDLLKLPRTPERIEGYDISHHQGEATVASMVVFEHGAPAKHAYRKFRIKFTSGINDPAMLHEVLRRRIAHAEWPKPDFMLIDGGKGQLSAAAHALKTYGAPFAAIAKREEELYVPGYSSPIKLKTLPAPLLHMLTHIRDESHRFAVSFHRQRRSRLVIPR